MGQTQKGRRLLKQSFRLRLDAFTSDMLGKKMKGETETSTSKRLPSFATGFHTLAGGFDTPFSPQ